MQAKGVIPTPVAIVKYAYMYYIYNKSAQM